MRRSRHDRRRCHRVGGARFAGIGRLVDRLPAAEVGTMRPKETLALAIASDTDECILWPHAVDHAGYGRMHWDGRARKVHVIVLELLTGSHPEGLFALHGPCHNPGCINPRHLHWGTHAENVRDTLRDGTRGKKLTPENVRQLRAEYATGGRSQRQLAAAHGVSQKTVHQIIHRQRWADVA